MSNRFIARLVIGTALAGLMLSLIYKASFTGEWAQPIACAIACACGFFWLRNWRRNNAVSRRTS